MRPAAALPLLALLLLAPAASATVTLYAQAEGGLRISPPGLPPELAAACEGSPAAPTWRVGEAGFTYHDGADSFTLRPRLASPIHASGFQVEWRVAWDLPPVLGASAVAEATLLADSGDGFQAVAVGASPAVALVNGEATFAFPLEAGPKLLPANSTLALEVVLRGTSACDTAPQLRLMDGSITMEDDADERMAVRVEAAEVEGRLVVAATATTAWGGYAERDLTAELELAGPSAVERETLEGPFRFARSIAMREAGEHQFSWIWYPQDQGAAPGLYTAAVSVFPTQGLTTVLMGEGQAAVQYGTEASPSAGFLLVAGALALAALARARLVKPAK